MKVSIDVDCTPEEARRFLGLPDLTPVHEAWVARVKDALPQATPEAAAEMMRQWSAGGLDAWRAMVGATTSDRR